MLTRLEINGFKSFHNFAFDFQPFQVFIGPNGVGKTNLFDAIVLLSHLASGLTLEEAFAQGRGEIAEQFTMYPDGTHAQQMTFAVEILIERTVQVPNGKALNVSSSRLRYELDLASRVDGGVEHVYVSREELTTIPEAGDSWIKEHIAAKNRKAWAVREKRPPFIETAEDKGQATIYRNQDSPGGGREAFTVGQIDKTVLSSSNPLRYPTAYAVQEAMVHWRFLQLNPPTVRVHGEKQEADALRPDGSNLPAVLERMSKDDAKILATVVRDLSSFIPDLKNLTVKSVPGRDESTIEIESKEGLRFSTRVLSDGTLRLLALVTLKNDPRHRGLLCFEEPENGVQPQRLVQIVDVLLSLSTKFGEQPSERGLRQVLVNTHSPGILTSVPANSLFYVGMRTEEKSRTTHIVPVKPLLIADADEKYYTWEQVKQYLDALPSGKSSEKFGF
jgi:predicted ATPase